MKKILNFFWKWLVTPLIGIIVIIMSVWAVFAIYFAKSPALFLRLAAVGIFIFANLAVFLNVKRRWIFLSAFTGTFILVLVWWSLIPASNDRNWATPMSVLPRATISNNFVTVYNIRNFDYKTATEYSLDYYDKTFDLNKLKKLYFIVSYWGTVKKIAHTFLSFEFEGGDFLAISIELRREKGETYDPVKGLFKMYELMYVIADERDVIRLRTNYTGEHVYLYPLKTPPEESRKLLLDMLVGANKLNTKPEFYNTIFRNCTVSLIHHIANVSENKINFYIEYLLNGFLDWRLYENGVIDTQLPPKEAKQAYFISDIAKKYDDDTDFSKNIRSHLPGFSSEESSLDISKIKPPEQEADKHVPIIPETSEKSSSDISKTKPSEQETDKHAPIKTETKVDEKTGVVKWNSDFTALKYSFGNGILKGSYPEDMAKDVFPPVSKPPVINSKKKWPDVFMNAKWTIDISSLPSADKANKLDSILMRLCNPDYYKEDFPKTIVSTKFTLPQEFKKEKENPDYNLIKSLRGKTLNYEVVMAAGFGASDYKIKTTIHIGANEDEKTIFYYDQPEHISNHLDVREFIFAAHQAKDKIFFEINIFCKCESSKFIRGTKMGRVENDSRYFIEQMYKRFN